MKNGIVIEKRIGICLLLILALMQGCGHEATIGKIEEGNLEPYVEETESANMTVEGKIQVCHEADFDMDGKQEQFVSVRVERESDTDLLEIYFIDDNLERIHVDTQEVATGEDYERTHETLWFDEGATLSEYHEKKVMEQILLCIGSTGKGYYRHILYGCVEGQPQRIKESEGWGNYAFTTYMYDGSIADSRSEAFRALCAGDFDGVISKTQYTVEEMKYWYQEYGKYELQCLECDVDHDGDKELYMKSNSLSAVFDVSERGTECWWWGEELLLLDDGRLMYHEQDDENEMTLPTDQVFAFDREGNQIE